jgi:pyruvate/2-oxoglutarate/acetoin dehydrogenase E1 component
MGDVLSYAAAAERAMAHLAADPRTLFVGQSVAYPGQRLFGTFAAVPQERRVELPIAEDFQLGYCVGLAIAGFVPVCFYPRLDFMLIAMNQLANHLDWMGQQVIVRTAVGSRAPLDPGAAHSHDCVGGLRAILANTAIFEPRTPDDLVAAYKAALKIRGPSIVVERMALYDAVPA